MAHFRDYYGFDLLDALQVSIWQWSLIACEFSGKGRGHRRHSGNHRFGSDGRSSEFAFDPRSNRTHTGAERLEKGYSRDDAASAAQCWHARSGAESTFGDEGVGILARETGRSQGSVERSGEHGGAGTGAERVGQRTSGGVPAIAGKGGGGADRREDEAAAEADRISVRHTGVALRQSLQAGGQQQHEAAAFG